MGGHYNDDAVARKGLNSADMSAIIENSRHKLLTETLRRVDVNRRRRQAFRKHDRRLRISFHL